MQKNEIVFYQFLIAVILLLHIYVFNKIPLQFDELLMYELISKSFFSMSNILMTIEIQMPLAYYLIKTMVLFFGDSSFILRLPSLLILFMLPWGFYQLSRHSLNQLDSLKSVSLLMMFHPIFTYSGSMRPYLMLIFFTILVSWELGNILKARPETGRWNTVRFSIFTFILLLIHPVGLCVAIFCWGVYLKKNPYGRKMFSSYVRLLILFSLFFIYYRYKDILHIFSTNLNFDFLFTYAKNISFLTSGGAFSLGIIFIFYKSNFIIFYFVYFFIIF